jgi:hypothetical protein
MWDIWACWRAATHRAAVLARAVHTFSSRSTRRGAAHARVTKGPSRRALKGGIVLGRTATAAFKHASSRNPIRQFTAPSAKSLVEGRRIEEHKTHVGVLRDVPCRDVLVERRRKSEHIFHAGDLRDVPCRDVLVERIRRVEHSIHVEDIRDVPCRDVPVEGRGKSEHKTHADNTRHVPCIDVRVERTLIIEQPIHLGDSGDVPTVDVTVDCSCFILIADPKINSTLQVIVRESNRGFREGERVEYNSFKRVRDDVQSLRLVWFGFENVGYLGLLEGCKTYGGCASQGGTYLQH